MMNRAILTSIVIILTTFLHSGKYRDLHYLPKLI